MSAIIKPEIFASWIPTGKIFLEPLIFATYIPAPVHEKNSADTLRKISKEESAGVDTLRKIGQREKFSADTKRALLKTEKAIADTSRKVGITIIRADLKRSVKSRITNSFDACRKIGIKEIFQADTKRTVGLREKFSADTFLQIAATEKIIADTMRGLREIIRADTFRRITRTEKFSARTVIRIPHILKYVIRNRGGMPKKILLRDTAASLINTFKDYGVTAINISLNEKTLSDEFTFDITQPMEINETVQGYLLDYPFHFIVEEITQTDLIRSVKGRYNVDEQLYTWFQMPYGDDGDDETGDNYPTATEAIQEIAGDLGLSADIHIDDFTPTNLQKGDMVTYSDVLNSVFSWTSRLPQRQINIFIRNGVLHCIQRGKETSVFDITNLSHSRPTINKKFNRVLCNNPNKSDNDDEEDNDDNTQPFSGVISYTTTNCKMRYEYKNGFLVSEYINFQPTYGARNNSSHITYKTYDYISFSSIKENDSTAEAGHYDDVIYYMASKTEQTITMEKTIVGDNITTENRSETFSKTTYFYRSFKSDEIYLFLEEEESSRKEYSSSGNAWNKHVTNDESEPSIRETYHVPLGNGWYAQTVYLDGVLQGGNISQGAPGNKVSPYTVNQIQNIFNFKGVVEEDNGINDQLQAIVDYSFPVREQSIKKQLNADLRWLHQKIVETVTVDLVSKVASGVPEINHIVDFTERIKLDGAEYFLVSNKISFTPRKLIQKLQLIRWY